MSNLTEFAITSDASGQLWNSCIWDPRAGTSLMIYKGGGVSAPHSLCILGNDYLLSAESVKPILHVWPLNSQETIHQGLRTVCPGRVSTLAASPDACYCVAGIEEKLHVWQMASGRLLAVATRHFQKVTCLRFTDDSSHFVSGGEDGMVMVWSLANLVCTSTGDAGDPRFIFSDHSLPVQDLAVGHGGIRARLVSVSSDRTCKVYDLASGSLVLSVVFGSSLTAVTMDPTEFNIFVGAVDGNIHQFNLREPPRMREYHMDSSDDKALTFVGHTKAVTCLSASRDGVTLLSGSNDERVLVWHIPSRQCTRVLPHKGPITNAFFLVAPKQVFTDELKPTVLIHSFQRGMDHDGANNVIDVITSQNLYDTEEQDHSDNHYMLYGNTQETKVKEQRDLYKKVNQDLYKFAVDNILKTLHVGTDTIDEDSTNISHLAVTESSDTWTPVIKALPKQKKNKKSKINASQSSNNQDVKGIISNYLGMLHKKKKNPGNLYKKKQKKKSENK